MEMVNNHPFWNQNIPFDSLFSLLAFPFYHHSYLVSLIVPFFLAPPTSSFLHLPFSLPLPLIHYYMYGLPLSLHCSSLPGPPAGYGFLSENSYVTDRKWWTRLVLTESIISGP